MEEITDEEPKYGTPFQETEAICAAGLGDLEYLERVLRGMSPTERQRLADAAALLEAEASRVDL